MQHALPRPGLLLQMPVGELLSVVIHPEVLRRHIVTPVKIILLEHLFFLVELHVHQMPHVLAL